jgi:tetratricopeptide (TPR) repeat protein
MHPRCRIILGDGHFFLGRVLSVRGKLTESDRNEAIRSTREAMRIYDQLRTEVPDYVDYHRSASGANYLLAQLLRADELETHYRQWIDSTQSLAAQFPQEAEYRELLNLAYSSIVDRLLSLNRLEDAHRWALEFVQCSASSAKPSSANAVQRFGLIQSKASMFLVLDRLKQWPDAARDVTELVNEAEQLAEDSDQYRQRVSDELWKCFRLSTDSLNEQVRDPLRSAQLAVTGFDLSPEPAAYRRHFGRLSSDQCKGDVVVSRLGDCKSYDRHVRPAALLWLAMAHCGLGQFERALDRLDRAIVACDEAETWMRKNPQNVDEQMGAWQATMAEMVREVPARLVAAGRPREARLAMETCIAWHRRLTKRNGDSHLHLSRLAWTLAGSPVADLRNPEEAIRLAEQSLSLSPQSRMARQALGVAYYRLRRFQEAAKQFDLLAELISRKGMDPNRTSVFFQAMTHWHLGHHEDARRMYARAEDRTMDEQWEFSRHRYVREIFAPLKEGLAEDALPTTQLVRAEAQSILSVSQGSAAKTAN